MGNEKKSRQRRRKPVRQDRPHLGRQNHKRTEMRKRGYTGRERLHALEDRCANQRIPADLVFAPGRVASTIPLFVSFEVRSINTLRRLGFLAALWE
jgi:hypothetical protein